ncbi:hypothetical protein [Bradyrhizobium sp. LHD-71]|uniref:hypothetical protein n=1 Tax=Bradyrhizobium sp. LHD-71 TaxID=3072141 RepID=UPI00280D6FC1|nr:hypothetical protein [Bradyrhizobium sp. LHD-71]MDQ8731128.1 hypothetical protein [Bradyrhizobium sp. LHD-71]
MNATKFAAALVLAGAMLVPAEPASAQVLQNNWRAAAPYYPEPYTDYYQTTTGPGRSGASGIPESAYSAAVPNIDSYAAMGPVVPRPVLTPREWGTGLRAPDWTAIHGG